MRTTDFSTLFFGVRKESEELCSTLASCGDWSSTQFPTKAELLCFNESNSHPSKLYMEGAQFGIGMIFPRGIVELE